MHSRARTHNVIVQVLRFPFAERVIHCIKECRHNNKGVSFCLILAFHYWKNDCRFIFNSINSLHFSIGSAQVFSS